MSVRERMRKSRRTPMSLVRLGIIGAGIMGERMLRAAVEHAADTVVIAGVWDPSPAARARIAAALPTVPWAQSAEALIAASDSLYIASPPAAHLQHTAAALAAGKAAFCEKPLSSDVPAAAAFLAAHPGARAAVNFPMATSFAAERIRAWLADGVIGTPQRLDVEVAFAGWPRGWQMAAASWLDGRAEGGFTREVVSHFLFLAHRLFGLLSVLEASASFPEDGRSERAISAKLTAGALPVSVAGSVGTTEKDDHNTWTLIGDRGAMRIRDWAYAERLLDGVWQADTSAMPQDVARPLVLKRQLAGVAALTRGEPHPLATLDEAFAVQRAVEAILAP
jgi:predicted dehydrogenase